MADTATKNEKSPPKTPTPKGSPAKSGSAVQSKTSIKSVPNDAEEEVTEDYYVTPEFIYGGPFIGVKRPSPFVDSTTPVNLTLQGTFKRSFAYFSLRDRLPHILTKVIDYVAREGPKIKSKHGASDQDLKTFMQGVVKLKNDLVTNKNYEPFVMDTPEARKWNTWLENQDDKKYFNNTFVFSECYVYRKMFEYCEMTKTLNNFDYFEEQKNTAFHDNLEPMCIVADRVVTMLNKSEKDKRKSDFTTLLKLCLWANKCDLSLSCGEKVTLAGGITEGPAKPVPKPPAPPPPPPPPGKKGKAGKKGKGPAGPLIVSPEPFQMILDLKERLLIDESNKIADQVQNKAEALRNKIAADEKIVLPEPPPPAEAAEGAEPPAEPPKIPCPAKMTLPNHVMFDIVSDNSGYELFTDLCLASFLIEQQIVEKVRFHVKKMPWFVSDVTPRDFRYVIDSCMGANFFKEAPEPKEPEPGKEPEPTKPITSENLKALGAKFDQLLQDGSFVVMAEDFWTYPHVFRDMKKYDFYQYRKLQYAVAVLYKGDLNYRKLLGERNVNPYTKLEPNLQGYIPAPAIAVRTVKSELICGMPKGRYELLQKNNEGWMTTGDYGLIQYCPKGEALKVSDRPCAEYGDECRGAICPDHKHDM